MFNEIITGAQNVFNASTHYVSDDLHTRVVAIVDAPFQVPEMLWMLVPIIATTILMEFYFGRYKEEELGWNTAFGNAVVLGFVAIDLFRHTYEPIGIGIKAALVSGDMKIIISMVLFGFAILLLLMDFFHFIPKKIAYAISSSAFIHLVALLGIIVVYSTSIPLNWTTLFACLLLFLLTNLILHLLYLLIPAYTSPFTRIMSIEDVEKEYKKKKNNDDD